MMRCMCGSKPLIKKTEEGFEIFCRDCTRPHAFGATKKDAKKGWNQLCKAERTHWERHRAVTGN